MGIARDFHRLWVELEASKQSNTAALAKLEMAERVIGWNKTTISGLQDQMNREVRNHVDQINKYEEIKAGLHDTIEKLREQVAFQLAQIKELREYITIQFGEGDPEVDNRIELIDPPESEVSDVEVDAAATFEP